LPFGRRWLCDERIEYRHKPAGDLLRLLPLELLRPLQGLLYVSPLGAYLGLYHHRQHAYVAVDIELVI